MDFISATNLDKLRGGRDIEEDQATAEQFWDNLFYLYIIVYLSRVSILNI